MTAPPDEAIAAALAVASLSPCAKSKRGAAIWDPPHRLWLSRGCNGQQPEFVCTGSAECRSSCGKICEHAEAMALRQLQSHTRICLDMLHVKSVDGVLVASGPPSCWQCSKAIHADGRIAGVWLFHADGWRRYSALEFHVATLETCGLHSVRYAVRP